MKCPFCSSEKVVIDTPYLAPVTHEPIKTFCCKKQAKNHEYMEKRFSPTYGGRPSREKVSKL